MKLHHLLLPLIAVSAISLQAQTNLIWQSTGTPNSDWSTAGNWSGSNVPDSNSERAFFRDNDGVKTLNNNNNVTINGIQFQNTGTMSGSGYTINGSGNTLTIDVNNSATFTVGIQNTATVVSSSFTHTINTNLNVNNSGGATAATTINSGTNTNITGGGLTIGGNLTATTIVNFGGVSGSSTLLTGNIVNSGGLRIGTEGAVTISGSGVTSGAGNVNFVSGQANLNRAASVSGANFLFNGGTAVAGSSSAFAGSGNIIAQSNSSIVRPGGFDQTFGTLQLLGTSALTFDFQNLGGSDLTFANSSALAWGGTAALNIINFDAASNSIRFGVDINGLTGTQLSAITINGASGAFLDSSGFLAIPEPSSAALIGVALAGFAFMRRRRMLAMVG
jgi:fibronectin-binding autotransporter adhesin